MTSSQCYVIEERTTGEIPMRMCSELHNTVANPEAGKAAVLFCHVSDVQLSAVIKDSVRAYGDK